jgi:hypothetical protein
MIAEANRPLVADMDERDPPRARRKADRPSGTNSRGFAVPVRALEPAALARMSRVFGGFFAFVKSGEFVPPTCSPHHP